MIYKYVINFSIFVAGEIWASKRQVTKTVPKVQTDPLFAKAIANALNELLVTWLQKLLYFSFQMMI